MKCRVNKEKCIGCGTCVALAGASFKFSGDGKVEAIAPAGDNEQTIKDTASACPVEAIEVEE